MRAEQTEPFSRFISKKQKESTDHSAQHTKAILIIFFLWQFARDCPPKGHTASPAMSSPPPSRQGVSSPKALTPTNKAFPQEVTASPETSSSTFVSSTVSDEASLSSSSSTKTPQTSSSSTGSALDSSCLPPVLLASAWQTTRQALHLTKLSKETGKQLDKTPTKKKQETRQTDLAHFFGLVSSTPLCSSSLGTGVHPLQQQQPEQIPSSTPLPKSCQSGAGISSSSKDK